MEIVFSENPSTGSLEPVGTQIRVKGEAPSNFSVNSLKEKNTKIRKMKRLENL
jgi:hypothetical protein